jgi:hypothetical protein
LILYQQIVSQKPATSLLRLRCSEIDKGVNRPTGNAQAHGHHRNAGNADPRGIGDCPICAERCFTGAKNVEYPGVMGLDGVAAG